MLEISKRLLLPKSTLESWLRVSRTGNLGKIGKSHCRLTELERELANVKRELALTKMERDIFKKLPRTLRRSRCKVRSDQGVATDLYGFDAMQGLECDDQRILCLEQTSTFQPRSV